MSKKKTPRAYSSKLDPVPEESSAAIKEVLVEEETKEPNDQEKEVTQEAPEAKKEEENQPPSPPKKKADKKEPKAKKKKSKKPKPPKKKQSIQIGAYTISVREGSAYASLYALVAELGGFKHIGERLDSLDTGDEAACKGVLKTMMVNREILERDMRLDDDYKALCAKKTAEYKKTIEEGGEGVERAQKILSNPRRSENGEWTGDIREMLSVCNGSSSNNASNRNITKLKEAGIAFRQFPRMPRRGHDVYIIMLPAKHLDKVNAALVTVFGDEGEKNFAAYIDTKFRSIFD